MFKGENTYYLEPSNKIIYRFLTKIFEFPIGKKYGDLKVPDRILNSSKEIKQWFLRGVFDADGDTRAVEAGFKSQSRIKIRMKSQQFIESLKILLEDSFNVSVNGPYKDRLINSHYIQIERQADIIRLSIAHLFFHPIKNWRLDKVKLYLLNKNALKEVVAES